MRKDMAKVVVECPRLNHYAESNVKGRKLDFDDMPYCEGMKAGRRRGWNRKSFSENLNPLRRYLERQVGRLWNDVFSEICENINPNSTVQQHVRSHIFNFVEINTYRGNDGNVHAEGTRYFFHDLYVDPDDGILRGTQRRRHRYPSKPMEDYISFGYERAYHRLSGIWFEVFYTVLPESIVVECIDEKTGAKHYRRIPPTFGVDVVNGKWSTPSIYSHMNRFAHAKRPLTTRELKKAGLVNC